MDLDERSYLEELKTTHERRLHKLEQKRALLGVSTPPEIEIEIEDITSELKNLRNRLHRARAIDIDLLCHLAIAPRTGATVQFDWTSHFHNGVAAEATWAQLLLPDLIRVYHKLGRSSSEPAVALRQRATMAAGIAFGAIFSASSGYKVWVEQRTDDREVQWWAAQEDSPSIVGLLLAEQRTSADQQASDTLIEISVAQDISSTVDKWLRQKAQPFAERIRFVPDLSPGRAVVPDAAHALAMARQIGEACVAAHNARPDGKIHLFVAAPFGLTLMIGRKLNACGLVQCYDLEKASSAYQPACLLNAPDEGRADGGQQGIEK